MPSPMQMTFLGAAGTVTGSKILLETDSARVLIDCGLYQGVKSLRLQNWRPLPVPAESLDAIVLSHAHIDHSGMIPRAVRDGFQGEIHASPGTARLCGILLPDAAHIQEEDADYANRKGFSKHHPALPLYTGADAENALEQIRPLGFGEERSIGDLRIRLQPAGHILGAASVEVTHRGRSILFSGDLGRTDDLLMRSPSPPGAPDYVVIESTYGDRLHAKSDPIETLAAILSATTARGGVLLIPSFAVGRAQTLLYCLHEIFRRELAAPVPVYVNSPMATSVTELFRAHPEDHRLQPERCDEVCGTAHFVRSVEESKALTERFEPMVILSASGMASGGRILHHLKTLAPDPRNTILLPGYQAPGTRGDSLARGVQTLKIHGDRIPVAAEVRQLDFLSAHADQQGLLDWLAQCEKPPSRVFVNHGDPVPSDTLRQLVGERLGLSALVPNLGERFELP